jgi:hypothetical protein
VENFEKQTNKQNKTKNKTKLQNKPTQTNNNVLIKNMNTVCKENKTGSVCLGGGTWPSSQRGALVRQKSQIGAPAVAVNQLFALTCC